MVELMVALAVFIVMAMAVGGALLATNQLSEQDEEYRVAMMDLQSVMETINGMAFNDIVTTYPDGHLFTEFYDLNLPSESLSVDYPDPTATNPLQIDLTVTWRGHDGLQKRATLSGLRVR